MFDIRLLPGSYGDAILIAYGTVKDPHYILMDGGPYNNFEAYVARLKAKALSLKKIELLVVTHIDIDHIDGVLRLLNQKKFPFEIENVWFNGFEQIRPLLPKGTLGYDQGDFLSVKIKDRDIPHNQLYFKGEAVMVSDYDNLPVIPLPGGMELTLLSPGIELLAKQAIDWENTSKYINDIEKLRKDFADDHRYDDRGVLGDTLDIPALQSADEVPDKSLANESSIAFLAKFEGKSCLFAGDAPTDALLRALGPYLEKKGDERLRVNAWKVAHHGSKKSTHNKLMAKIDAEHLLISTDGTKYGHPHPETLAKLLKHKIRPVHFHFNYRTNFNEKWDDAKLKKKYDYITHYPAEGEAGITLAL